jgi:L-ascorbate metabolism protein UlaG (beta-lactamase superfamily)
MFLGVIEMKRANLALVVSLLAILAVAAVGCDDAPERRSVGDPLEVTFLANEGFLLHSGDSRVLIDGLFREGVDGYGKLTLEQRELVETAEAPFNTINFVLATHLHDDHFNPLATCRYLNANPLAEFITTRQAAERIAKSCSDFGKFNSRVKIGLNDDGSAGSTSLDSLEIESIRLHHGATSQVDNVGYRITIGGRTVVHLGDTQVSPDEMRAAGMADKPVDIAFVPYWYMIDDDWLPAVTEVIAPRLIVVMHLPPEGSRHLTTYGGWEPLVGTIKHRFKNAVVFSQPFETQTF